MHSEQCVAYKTKAPILCKKKKLLSKFTRRNWASFKNEIFDRLIKSLLASVITD